jgi:hypothetical protein
MQSFGYYTLDVGQVSGDAAPERFAKGRAWHSVPICCWRARPWPLDRKVKASARRFCGTQCDVLYR